MTTHDVQQGLAAAMNISGWGMNVDVVGHVARKATLQFTGME
jgi:hypothetical protein